MAAGSPAISMPELHSPVSGRLDARRIAEYLSVPLSGLALAIGIKDDALGAAPDMLAVQAALLPIKSTLDILNQVIGDHATILVWLNTPHPDLGNRTSLGLILDGHATVVAGMLQDAMEGMLT